MSNPVGDAFAFVTAFNNSPPQTIDLFLSRNPQYSTIGKVAILLSILSAERDSRFGDRVEHPEMDWYSWIFARLTADLHRRGDFRRFTRVAEKVSFITFNYDRSLEHFLYDGLRRSFTDAAHNDQVAGMVDMISPIHIYGRLAPLDWQDSPDSKKKLAYGAVPQAADVKELIGNLQMIDYKTKYRDGRDAYDDLDLDIEEAEELWFLGFGYAEDNLGVLDFPRALRPHHHIYGTALGRTPKEIVGIRTAIGHGPQHKSGSMVDSSDDALSRIHISPCDSAELLRQFF